jgi:3-oxoadipate enol-lactonase
MPVDGPEMTTSSSTQPTHQGRAVRGATASPTWAWEVPGPPGAPDVLLVHGWMATAALNWYGSLEYLGRSFHTVAPNLRGHGRLGPAAPHFSVEASADDLAELIDALPLERPIVIGYSMGGAVAQVLAKNHPEMIGGIVLCATAASFARRQELRPVVRVVSKIAAAGSRRYPDAAKGLLHWQIARHDRTAGSRGQSPMGNSMEWAMAERSESDLATFIEAGAALNAYDSSNWLPDLKVPAAVVITARDRTVVPWRQEALAALIPGARRYMVDAGHDVVVASPALLLPVLVKACQELMEP